MPTCKAVEVAFLCPGGRGMFVIVEWTTDVLPADALFVEPFDPQPLPDLQNVVGKLLASDACSCRTGRDTRAQVR